LTEEEEEDVEICILKFDETTGAEDALNEVRDAEGDRNPWLHEVGAIARPLLGRVRVALSLPDGKSKTLHEGDLAEAAADYGGLTGYYLSALSGPLGPMFGTVHGAMAAGARASDLENRLFQLDELKKALPRDSSALVFVGSTQACDAMVRMFDSYGPKVIRRDVTTELRNRLEALHQRIAQEMAQSQSAPTNP
jgi:uncharacterized membrane protein